MTTKHRKPGRPEIGGRVSIALGPLLARIDAIRGRTSRASWLRSAAEHALACSDTVTLPADPPLVDLPEDFLDHGPRPSGQVGWRCRYCGKGRVFLGAVREEAAEARTHEARCAMNPTRTTKPTTEEETS